jgi:transposase
MEEWTSGSLHAENGSIDIEKAFFHIIFLLLGLYFTIKKTFFLQQKLFLSVFSLNTLVGKMRMSIDEVVEAYRDLSNGEYAFRTMKTTEFEMRPMYHKNEERIKAHVFVCMLSYYLFWHMRQRLQSMFEADGKGKNRCVTFDNIIDTLKCIRMEKLSIFDNIAYRTTVPTEEQQSIIGLLGVEL